MVVNGCHYIHGELRCKHTGIQQRPVYSHVEAHRMNPALVGLACLLAGLVIGLAWGYVGGSHG